MVLFSLSSALMAYSSAVLSAMSTWWWDWLWKNMRLVFMCVRINVSGLYFGSIHGVCWNNVRDFFFFSKSLDCMKYSASSSFLIYWWLCYYQMFSTMNYISIWGLTVTFGVRFAKFKIQSLWQRKLLSPNDNTSSEVPETPNNHNMSLKWLSFGETVLLATPSCS